MERSGNLLKHWTRDWGRQICRALDLAQAGQKGCPSLMAEFASYLNRDQRGRLFLPGAIDDLADLSRCFRERTTATADRLEYLSLNMTENVLRVGLPGDMLRKVDMMSMLAGIEVRVPMLDDEVLSVGLSLPHHLKADGHTGKLVLRSLASQWLPPKVASHRKHGFSVPIDVMVTGDFHQLLNDILLGSDARLLGVVDMKLVQQWLSYFKQAGNHARVGSISREGLYQRIFFLLALEIWLRDHRLSW
jgi:asparagine synthetase B (glutamine-hydrolysing)